MVALKDAIGALPQHEQDAIAAETDRLRAEFLTLQDLRRAREFTQVQLAETLGKTQSAVANMERRTDLLLSTLRSYVEAMGGELDLVARFPDRPPVVLTRLCDDDDRRPPA